MRPDRRLSREDFRALGGNFGRPAKLRAQLHGPIYGVLGNHDSIQMVPAMETMGIRMLLNECEAIARGDQLIYLAGIDDAHFYRVDNIEKAALPIPDGAFSILLSHTPEVYRQAAMPIST